MLSKMLFDVNKTARPVLPSQQESLRKHNRLTFPKRVAEIDSEKNRVKFKTTCTNQEGTLVRDGEALVSPPKSAK
jgi:hypothetical protein